MAFREFLQRHRIASAVAAPAILGGAAIVAASFALTAGPQEIDTSLKASVTECHDMVTISVAGRNDTPREGTTKMLVDANGNPLPAALSGDHSSQWVDPVVNAPNGTVPAGSYAAVYIAYPANMDSYEDAVTTGVANSEQVMREISAACPDTQFSIVGYSEGADVARRVAMNIGNDAGTDGQYKVVNPDNVVGVVIIADAGRQAGEGPFPGAKDPNRPDNFDKDYQNGGKPVSGQGALPGTSGGFGKLDGKVASFCNEGDLTCAAPENISLLQLVVNVGRQLNVDSLERDGLTPATGQDVATVLADIAMKAFSDIGSNPNWMASDETFLDVLLKVSDPGYKPGANPAPVKKDSIEGEQLSPLAYLPQKIFNEIVGLIVTNQNTIPVVMSDPYNLTLGDPATGHHFDYWRDANGGKPLTSAQYAAAWLTHLAQQAQQGKKVDTAAKPEAADLLAVQKIVEDSKKDPDAADASKAATTSPSAAAKSEAATSSAATRTTTTGAATTDAATTTTDAATTTTEAPAETSTEATTPEATPTEAAKPAETDGEATPGAAATTTAPSTTTTTPVAPAA